MTLLIDVAALAVVVLAALRGWRLGASAVLARTSGAHPERRPHRARPDRDVRHHEGNLMTEIDPATAAPRTRRRTITIASLTLGALATGGVIAAVAATSANASGSSAPSASGSSSSSSAAAQCAAGTDFDGLITTVDSSSVTVRDLLGTPRTYAISSSTSIHEGPSTQVSASSLTAGEHVHVHGTKSGSAYGASDIDVRHAAIDGRIISLGATTITVTDRDGFTRSIVTDGSTTYSSAGRTVSRSTLTSGIAIHAEGSVDGNGTSLDADSVSKLVAGAGPGGAPSAPKAGGRPAAPPKGTAPKVGGGPECGPAGRPEHGPGGGPVGRPPRNGTAPSGAPSGAPTSRPSGAPSAPATPSGSAS